MSKRNRWAAVSGVLVLALAALVVVLWPRAHSAAPAAAPAPLPVVTRPVVAPVTPTKPAVPHAKVAAAAPTFFQMWGPAFTVKANVCQMDFVLPLDPPGEQHHTVCWVREKFGVAPSYPSTGTSYVLGHAWAEDYLVLNPLSEFATKQFTTANPTVENGVPLYHVTNLNGYKIALRGPHGTLTYVVTRAFAVAKEKAAQVPSIMADKTPNRVVLLTCAVKNGQDLDYNIVVYATLMSSTAV